MLIGLISDTHGLLRPQALAALQGCDAIVHGGDIGPESLLQALAAVAPVHAVRGNNDTGAWAQALPHQLDLRFGAAAVRVVHDLKTLQGDARADRIDVVVAGHSHRPSIARRDGVLFVNPGSAGPRRFRLPVSLAHLHIDDSGVAADLVELAIGP